MQKESPVGMNFKFAIIENLSSDFSIHILCKTLGVLKSTYYHHKLRSPEKSGMKLMMKYCALLGNKFLLIAMNDLVPEK